MSAKRIVFPPQENTGSAHEADEPVDRDLFSGDVAGYAQQHAAGNTAAKARAVYASAGNEGAGRDLRGRQPFPDEMPSYDPSRSCNPLGDFPEDALFALQEDHDEDRREPREQPDRRAAAGAPAPLSDAELAALCRERICPACPEKKEADEQRLRAAADLDNAGKRLAREREEQARFASVAVLSAIIPSLDNLDLALQHAAPDAACKNFVTGVRMTRKLLGDALAAHGLEQIGQVGEEFDPAVHEAVGTEDFPDVAAGCVGKLLTAGYKLRERLLRPARVLVCKKHETDADG
ncbi:MAG: nucleotide exchange factor GrpE [Desulfovibrio sp.]|jgi:molecular chaperone GrpE|nr:nucleotide exchange factor GrpE [Desulfovibrio sp.]